MDKLKNLNVDLTKVKFDETEIESERKQLKEAGVRDTIGSQDRLTAGVMVKFAPVIKHELKKYDSLKTVGYVLPVIEASNNASDVSLNSLTEIIKAHHLGTDKAHVVRKLCALLAGQTLYVKNVSYQYIKFNKGGSEQYAGIRSVEWTQNEKDITVDDIKTSNANIDAYKEADGNYQQLYEQQELAKTAPKTTTTSRSSRKNK